jgi:hypothetical protein
MTARRVFWWSLILLIVAILSQLIQIRRLGA